MRRKITDLREQRASLFEQMKAISEGAEAEGRDLNAEETQSYERLSGEFDSVSSRVERLEREAGIEPTMTRDVAHSETEPERADRAGLRGVREERTDFGWFLRADGTRTALPAGPNYRDAFDMLVRNAGRLEALTPEQRVALNVGTNSQGGFLVPDEFFRSLVESAREFGHMREDSTIITTGENGDLLIPKVATNSAAVWLAEAAAYTESDATFAQAILAAFKVGLIAKASDEMVADSAFDVLGFLAKQAGQAIGITTNAAYTNGASGSTTTPEGIVNKATVGVTLATGQTTTISSADSLIDLYHSVIDPYRSRSTWMLHDTTLKIVRKFKDTTNQYIWQPGLQAGQPDTLLGRPIRVNPDVPVPAANAKSIVFGDLKSYWIRDVQGVEVKPLTELYAANGQIALRSSMRTDGDLIDTAAVRVLQHSAT